MKDPAAKRAYRQVARAEAAQATVDAAQRAAFALWRERDFEEVTLADVAERAGVTVQTLIRRFGSKLGLLEHCLAAATNEVTELRDAAEPGDLAGALRTLLTHYERDGDAVIRTLHLEGRSETADRILARGRAQHRAWCERVFGPFLPRRGHAARTARLDAFVGATDVYLWKLWRRDLGHSRARTHAALMALVRALAESPVDGYDAEEDG